jgi:hypothetical protein
MTSTVSTLSHFDLIIAAIVRNTWSVTSLTSSIRRFLGVHARGFCLFCSPHGNEKMILNEPTVPVLSPDEMSGLNTSTIEEEIVLLYTLYVCGRRPRKDKRGVDLISDVLPFGQLWYLEVRHTIGYAKFYSRSHDAVIRSFD